MRYRLSALSALLAATAVLVSGVALTAALPASAFHRPTADPAVITDWNAIAVNTIAGAPPNGAGLNNAEGIMWFGFVQAAVYNAVEGITGDYNLYDWNERAPIGASPEAAAAVAAHGVLMNYFGTSPTIAANLDAALVTSLARVPDGVPKDQGILYGERAAERLIELRTGDGRFAPIVFNVPPAPGVWRPTPPANAPFLDPWLSQVRPFMLDSDSQFRPAPPPALNSDQYLQEFKEVRDYGGNAATGSLRSPAQTDTALFFSRDIGAGPYQAALRDMATRHGLNISQSARMFAAVDVSLADTIFAVWDGKFHYGKWRPITAIREADTDGDPNTTGVPGWTPLIATPNYPDYPSGLSGVTGDLSTALARLGLFDLNITSPDPTTLPRHYTDPAAIQRDIINARVWNGIHFRSADVAGVAIGVQVANWALDHYFAPTR
jgi:PAP2 superfamily